MSITEQIEQLIRGGRQLGIELSHAQLDLFERYLREILDWNKRRSIVSRRDTDRIASYHFIDSLSALQLLPEREGIRCLDLGAGAGFPGIPLKIARPDLELILSEPRRWRYLFLEKMIETLGLDNTQVLRMRAEEMQQSHAGYDVVLARAVAKLGDLVSLSAPLLSPGGIIIAFKSRDAVDEINKALKSLLKASAKVVGIKKLTLPFTQIPRVFVIVEKL